jgi:hypothetical protein
MTRHQLANLVASLLPLRRGVIQRVQYHLFVQMNLFRKVESFLEEVDQHAATTLKRPNEREWEVVGCCLLMGELVSLVKL